MVLDPKDVDAFIAAALKENLEATPVAVVTDNNRLEMTWRGDKIVDISRDFPEHQRCDPARHRVHRPH